MTLVIRMPFQDALIVRKVPRGFALLWRDLYVKWGGQVALVNE